MAKPLQSRPETVTQMIGLATVRMINAAAWKLSAPAPAWLAEMHSLDHVRQLARSMQADSWTVSTRISGEVPFSRFIAARNAREP